MRLRYALIASFIWLLTLPGARAQEVEFDYDSMIQESLRLRNAGDFTEAEALLRQAVPLARETNEVDLLLGLVIAFQERYIEATRILDEALEKYPNDEQLILGKARVLSYQGFYNEAIEIADDALELDPQNTDARNLKARVFYYQRHYDNARFEFNAVLGIDPDNLEAWIGLHDAEQGDGNEEAAELALERAGQLAPGHIDVVSRRERASQPVAALQQLIASFSTSDVDQAGLRRWYDRTLEYRYRNSAGNEYFVRGEHAHRFGLHDTLAEIGLVRANKRRSFELSLAYTPDDEILPEHRIRVGTEFLLQQANDDFGATTLGIGLTNAKYQTGNVQWLQLNFTHYLLDTNAWVTPGINVVRDETGERTVGWNLGLHWQTGSRTRIGYDYTNAPETELSVTTKTTSNHVYLLYELNDTAGVRLDASRIERERSYTREELALSLVYRF